MNAGIVILIAVLCFLLGALLVWLFLRRRLAAAETRYGALMASHQKKEKEAAECAARADGLERARAAAAAQVAERDQKVGALEAQGRDHIGRIQSLEAELGAARSQAAGHQQELASCRAEFEKASSDWAAQLAERDQKVGALEAQGRDHIGRIQSLEAELGAARSQTAAHQQELASCRAEFEKASSDWAAQLAERDRKLSLLEAGRAAPVMGIASLDEPGATAAAPAEPDDLALIEGIGPKISRLLQDSGIRTFPQLAESSVERLQRILDQARLRLADPGTWPEQARLAAAGDWEALSVLQSSLKGGR